VRRPIGEEEDEVIHPNEQKHRELYEAWSRGEAERAFAEGYTDDVVAHFNGRHRYSGDVVGKTALMEAFGRTYADFANQQLDLHDVIANDTHMVFLWTFRWERDGRVLEGKLTSVYNLDADGKISEAWLIDDDPEGIAEFIASFES
jgi:predicted ester cyclase